MPFGQVIPVTGPLSGFPGTIGYAADVVTVAKTVLNGTPDNVNFGDAVVVVPISGGGDAIVNVYDYILATASGGQGGTLTAAKFAGVAVRHVKSLLSFPVNPDLAQGGSYAPNQKASVAVRGTLPVLIRNGSPSSQGTVYIRKATNASFPNGVIGGFEAQVSDSSTNCVALTNVVFKDGNLDANGVAYVTLLERQAA